MLIVALATLRTRWAAFAGTFAALALGVSVIATTTLVLAAASGGSAHQRPERFGAVPYVIQADPDLQVRGPDGSVDSVPLLAQPDVPAAAIAQLPGAVPDRSFYAQVEGVPGAQPALGHGWSSAAFAPYVLTSGHAPSSDDEIVVAGPATVGSRVAVVTAGGSRIYTIAGTVRPRTGEQPVFFTDAEAARLSPGVDALVTFSAATAGRAAALPGAHLLVRTGTGRHAADPGAMQDAAELAGLTTFLGVAALLSAFVAVTVSATAFGLSVAQRRRDLALLRTTGATPKQVIGMVCAEAALVGAAGSAAGCLIGLAGAPQLAGWIVRQGLAPSWFSVNYTAGSVTALAIAFLAGIAVAVLSVLVAAVRAGTVRPAEALREAAVEPKRIGRIRLLGGLAALCCGLAALAAVAAAFPSAATDPKTEAEILILLVGGTALLSPFLLHPLTRPFGRGTAGMLLRASTQAGPRLAAAVIVPVLITVGLSASILGANDIAGAAASAGEHQQAAGADLVVLPETGTPGLTTALLNRIDGISGVQATAVTDTSMLARQPQVTSFHLEPPVPIPFPALGIDRPSAALNLKVIAGSLTGLGDKTIAVDTSWNEHVGDTISLWQPDGTPVSLKVIAVVAASLSRPGLIVDLRNAAAMPQRVYVTTDSSSSDAALLAAVRAQHARVVPVSGWSAAVSDQQARQNQVGLELLLGIAIAYSAIGIASTCLMSVAGRRPELALLHKTGGIRRQIVWFIAAESLVLTLIGIGVSAVVSCLFLGSLDAALAGAFGSIPLALPWPMIGAILTGCLAIAVLTSALPAWLQFRPRRPMTVTGPAH